MLTSKIRVRILASCTFCGLSAGLIAAPPVSVTSVGALGPNDHVNWASLGSDGDALGASFSALSANGLALNVSGADTSFNGFERADQGNSWDGNFAPGASLLWTGFSDQSQTVTIDFASPVFGAGAQIGNDIPGAFTAQLSAYDGLGNLIYSDTFSGSASNAADNSAIFIGVLGDVPEIAKIQFGVAGSGSFAIGQLEIAGAPVVPETGEYLGLMLGLTFFGMNLVRNGKRSAA